MKLHSKLSRCPFGRGNLRLRLEIFSALFITCLSFDKTAIADEEGAFLDKVKTAIARQSMDQVTELHDFSAVHQIHKDDAYSAWGDFFAKFDDGYELSTVSITKFDSFTPSLRRLVLEGRKVESRNYKPNIPIIGKLDIDLAKESRLGLIRSGHSFLVGRSGDGTLKFSAITVTGLPNE